MATALPNGTYVFTSDKWQTTVSSAIQTAYGLPAFNGQQTLEQVSGSTARLTQGNTLYLGTTDSKTATWTWVIANRADVQSQINQAVSKLVWTGTADEYSKLSANDKQAYQLYGIKK